MLLTKGDRELPIVMPSLCWEITHLKTCGSQTNLQKFHYVYNLQDRKFCLRVIIMEFIYDDLQGFVDRYNCENADVKAIERA
jgi:hypothetical protein